MFTGLVEGMGRIAGVERTRSGWRLSVRIGALSRGMRAGDSLAVDGCCLTALRASSGGMLRFDVIPETWRKTTLRFRASGDAVNLERPLKWGDRLDGHLVQGHVDGTGRIRSVAKRGREVRMEVALGARLARYAFPKGSIALDGVSLTIARVRRGSIEVALIPKTLRRTTLGIRKAGDRLNVEADLLAKMAGRMGWRAITGLRRPALPRRPTRARRAPRRASGRPSGARPVSRS